MRTVGAVVLLVLAATAFVQAPVARAAPACERAHLRLTLQVARNMGGTWLGVVIANRGPTCRLSGGADVLVLLIVRGRRARVAGNGLRMRLGGVLAHGRRRVLPAQWSNWCGARRVRLVVRLRSKAVGVRPRVLPRCLAPSAPSRLLAVP